jgi:hypothetical protein
MHFFVHEEWRLLECYAVWFLCFVQEPHSVTSQKTPFFIVIAVKTSNRTSFFMLQEFWQQEKEERYAPTHITS